MREMSGVTFLHLSDLQFGKNHLFEEEDVTADDAYNTLFERLKTDLVELGESHKLSPDVVLLTGDLAEWGMATEFEQVASFANKIQELYGLARRRVLVVPGNHDVNRNLCSAYFSECAGEGGTPIAPYWKKWRPYSEFFSKFYAEVEAYEFSEQRPWTLFELTDLNLVVAGLNSTIHESHREDDHYGWLGERQLTWFRDRLRDRSSSFRVAAIHHNVMRQAVRDDENLRDAEDMRRLLSSQLNLILHGHRHESGFEMWAPNLPILSTGSAAVAKECRGDEVPNQYQFVRIERDSLQWWRRMYARKEKRFVADARQSERGNSWIERQTFAFGLTDDTNPPGPPRSSTATASLNEKEAALSAVQVAPSAFGPNSSLARTARHEYPETSNLILLTSERLLLALQSRIELADMPQRIIDCSAGDLGTQEVSGMVSDWRKGLLGYVGTGVEVPPDAEDAEWTVRLLGPIAACHVDLRNGLRGLVVRPIPRDVPGRSLLTLIRGEQKSHLHHVRAVGARTDVDKVLTHVAKSQKTRGKTIIVRGPEGYGKSALVSDLAQRLSSGTSPCGQSAVVVARECPWLPGSIVIHGKSVSRPVDIVRLLLVQANCMLVRPIVLPPELERDPGMAAIVRRIVTEPDRLEWQEEESHASDALLRACLTEMLSQLVLERGSAVVIVDALDEIGSNGRRLGFLPDALPFGATMVLTSRASEGAANRLASLQPVCISLHGVDRDVAHAIAGVESAELAERLAEEAQGSPLLLHLARTEIEAGADPDSLDLTQTGAHIFDAQLQAWRQPDTEEERDTRYQVLCVLAVMESVSPLPWDSIQGFLDSLGLDASKSQLRELLHPVASQLQGLHTGQLKLGTKKLADYVRQERWSGRDRIQVIQRISAWLGQDQLAGNSLKAGFVSVWTDRYFEKLGPVRDAALGLVDLVGDPEDLFQIYRGCPADEDGGITVAARRFLFDSAKRGCQRAMIALGSRILDGDDLGFDAQEGEKWLRDAIDSGSDTATWILGRRLLDGNGVEANPVEGERLLRTAAERGVVIAMLFLGETLLESEGVMADPLEGEQWLRAAVAHGDTTAMWFLGGRLLDGRRLKAQPAEGEKWLRVAVAEGDTTAMWMLGGRLLDGDGLEVDSGEGEKLLRAAVDQGDATASGILGGRLLDGQGLEVNRLEGEERLRASVELGDSNSMRVLASRLLNGDGLDADLIEGEKWLRAAVAGGDITSMWWLGRLLLDGDRLELDRAEGERLLRTAAGKGDTMAMRELGCRLLDGKGVDVDGSEGEKLLREAVGKGDSNAMLVLGSRLLDGEGIKADGEDGEKLLRAAASRGNVVAMRVLGQHLLNGEPLEATSSEGDKWLREAVDGGDAAAAAWLGFRLYNRAKQNPPNSGLLQSAGDLFLKSSRDSEDSSVCLAYMIRRGEFCASDLRVEDLLAEPVSRGNGVAMMNMALYESRTSGRRDVDWARIDALVSRAMLASDYSSILEWWGQTLSSNDPEGSFVFALLWRNGHGAPSAEDVAAWWKMAGAAGWPLPLDQKEKRLTGVPNPT